MCYKNAKEQAGRNNAMKTVFDVRGMTCEHCVKAVTRAVLELDPQADVEVDLASGTVEVESAETALTIMGAITEAGYETSERPA